MDDHIILKVKACNKLKLHNNSNDQKPSTCFNMYSNLQW